MATFNLSPNSYKGITFIESQIRVIINWVVNPFSILTSDHIDNASQEELSLKASPDHKELRKSLRTQEGFGNYFTLRSDFQNDVRFDRNKDGKEVSNLDRHRSFQEVSLSPLLYLIAVTIATDKLSRLAFSRTIGMIPLAPTIFFEFYKKVRISNCGIFTIFPIINEEEFNDKADKMGLNAPGSYFTLQSLRTDEGMFRALTLLHTIALRCPNYFPTTESIKFSEIPYNAGDQTTFCSMSYDVEENNITLLQHNSYPGGSPTLVNLIDIVLLQPCFATVNGIQSVLTFCHPLIPTGISTFNLGTCICDRALGVLTNESFIDDTATQANGKPEVQTGKTKEPNNTRRIFQRPSIKWKQRNFQNELNNRESRSFINKWNTNPNMGVSIFDFNNLSSKVDSILNIVLGKRQNSPML